ncbi:IS66 family insertion sequence element accessory protein TnpB [Bradyrhizobium sp. 183]|uniref:IS66 family insertion sequence element accessory protein TnpB n=1 Tax=unclassified Bradyrhizobium TaxID=2631580 RepID=UPI001FFE7BB1|nr:MULTISPECIES: IS66 family insertion sequence element accessory protein TnpB [unclassified Bradyrhizobium]UPJ79765.1 IS66 family insertion sequence element accessory protein TnpB [Bradyrhizobium sp. 184]UPJ87560.1 IS66 family insertion sequence element accessory protein TnpB [Bradyrhizobium sp. 183]
MSIWIATQPIDFRRGMDSLAMLVSEAFGANPYDGGLYVFRSKRRDRVKILTWDGSGLVLYYCGIRGKAATDSDGRRPPIPIESGHPIRTNAATLLIG